MHRSCVPFFVALGALAGCHAEGARSADAPLPKAPLVSAPAAPRSAIKRIGEVRIVSDSRFWVVADGRAWETRDGGKVFVDRTPFERALGDDAA